MRAKATFDTFVTQAIALLHPERQKQIRGTARRPQQLGQQSKGGNAINVVISKQNDPLSPIDRVDDPRYSPVHLRQQKWVAQQFEARPQESFDFMFGTESFPRQKPRDTRRLANLTPRYGPAVQFFRRSENPSGLHHSEYP